MICTHANTFHPDELLAVALLQRFVFASAPAPVIRTRDEEQLARFRADPTVFVVDVGFEFDPERRNFDHHQGAMADTWPDGTPYSACGLVWKWLRAQGSLAEWPDPLLDALEERLIKRADRYDNGVGGPWPEGDFLGSYNRSSGLDSGVSDAAFARAQQVAADLLDNTAHALSKELRAEEAVKAALVSGFLPSHGILVMPDNRSGHYATTAARQSGGAVNLLVVPRGAESWVLVTAPSNPDDPFSQQTPAPEAWRGRGQEWVDLPDRRVFLEFCHKNGFLSAVRGNRADAVAAAQFVCENAHPRLRHAGVRRVP